MANRRTKLHNPSKVALKSMKNASKSAKAKPSTRVVAKPVLEKPIAPASMEKLKQDCDFDRFVAETIAFRIKQRKQIDPDLMKSAISRSVNPRLHKM